MSWFNTTRRARRGKRRGNPQRQGYRRLQGETLERRLLLVAEIEPNDLPADATALPQGDVLEGEISGESDIDFFRVSLDQGDEFSINTFNINAPRFSPTLPPGIEITDAAGRVYTTSTDGDAIRFVAPRTEAFLVRVTSQNVFGTFTGPYAMQSNVNDADVADAEVEPNDLLTEATDLNALVGSLVTGEFDDVLDQDYFSLDGSAGETLVVAFAGLSESAPDIQVLDAAGTLIAQDDTGIGVIVGLDADGQYFLRLTPGSTDPLSLGGYAMVADLVNNAEVVPEGGDTFETASAVATGYSGTLVGALESVDDRDLFRFEIDDLEALRFDLRLDPGEIIAESGKEMRIYNALGQLIIQSPGGRVSTETRDALLPGTYYLEVIAEKPIGDGTYEIDYVTITDFSLQRDRALHYMDFNSNDPYLGFDRVAAYGVPAAIDYYIGSFLSRYGVYEVDVTQTQDNTDIGKEAVRSGIGNFGDIGAGGFGGGNRGFRSSRGNTVNNALETSVNGLAKLGTALVNHEFGHAVGLPHARDVQAVMSYVGTSEYLPVGATYAFQGTDSRRPGNQTYDVRDYLDVTLQPGAQVYVSEATESAGNVALDSYLHEMSVDYEPLLRVDTGARPFDIVKGDFNNDGFDDIAIAHQNDNTIDVAIGVATGGFGQQATVTPNSTVNIGWWTDPMEVGDLDNDGDDDLVYIDYGDSSFTVLQSDGDGTFTTLTANGLQGRPQGFDLADFNEDDILDVAVTTSNDTVHLLLGVGDGTFGAATEFPVGSNPHGVSAGDLNGDGFADLVTTNIASDDLSVYFGDGTGGLDGLTTVAAGDGPLSIVVSDFNNDGFDDAAVAYRGDREVEIFHANPLGQLVAQQSFDTRITTQHLSSEDIDGDGIEDLFVGGFGNTLKVLLGADDGRFTRPISIETGNGESMAIATDFNRDGDKELVVTNYWSNTWSVADEDSFATENDRVVLFGAIDDDGDTDEYTIDVAADQRMTFDIEAAEFQYGLDAVLSVFSRDGTLLGTSDDAVDGNTGIDSTDPFLDMVFAADDTVTIRVEGKLGSAGNYRLKVTPERAIESISPRVIAMFPDNGASVDATRELTFFFDSVIDPDSLTAENIRVFQTGQEPVSGTAVMNPLDSTVVWTADAPLAPGTYQIQLISGDGGITDLAGNPLDGASASFAFPAVSGDDSQPPADFGATITITAEDTTPATLRRDITYIRDPYNASRFVLRMSDQMSMQSVHTADFLLRGDGPDGTFDTADDVLIELDATYDSISSKNNSIIYLYSRGVVDSGNYRVEGTVSDVAGNVTTLSESISVGMAVPTSALFTDAGLSAPGLVGSYVNSNLQTVDELDWRVSQTISGTRSDANVDFNQADFGVRADVGVTGGADDTNWDNFSVQWDGYVVIPEDGVRLQTRSDDSSRYWIDLDGDGSFEPAELFDNNWGNGQPTTTGAQSTPLDAGTYPVRIQYQEGGGGNEMHFEWILPGLAVPTGGFIHGPSVSDISPAATLHEVNDSINELVITFSGNIDPTTLTTSNMQLWFSDDATFYDGNDIPIDDADGVIEWDATTNQAIVDFASPLRAGFYLLNLNGDEGGIANTAGYLLDGEFLSSAVSGTENIFLWQDKPSGNGIQGGDFVAPFSIARPALEVEVVPSSISENGGQALAIITRRFADLSQPMFVTLSVSDATELRLASTFVSFPVGVESISVPVRAVDDNIIDGSQFVTITATADDIQDGEAVVEVTDFESFDLRLSSPSIFENGDIARLTLIREDASQAVVVTLTSSLPSKLGISPAIFTMLPGVTEAEVTLLGIDNDILDGTRTVTITASSNQFVDATIDIDVLDFEPLTFNVAPDSISENGGVALATLTRTDPTLPVVVSLGASPDSLVTLPPSIQFNAGESVSVEFPIVAIDNQTVDGTRIASLTASGGGYIDGRFDLTIQDFEELEFVVPDDSVAENAGRVQVQLRRSDPSGDLVASLSSSNPFRLRTPASAEFADGETLSEPFDLLVRDNTLPDGDEVIRLAASAFGYQLGVYDLLLTDFEPLELALLGGNVFEASGEVQFQLTRPSPAGEATIEVSGGGVSTLQLPETVRFDAGSTRLVFSGTVIDNDFVSDNPEITVTAGSRQYIESSVSFEIIDNDTPMLMLELESDRLLEGALPTQARLLRNTLTPLDVSVAASIPGVLEFPQTLSFSSGRRFVEFDLGVIDDEVASGLRSINLTFNGLDHPITTGTVQVTDDEIAGFEFLRESLELTEGGGAGLSSLVLSTQPASEVIVTLTSEDTNQLTVTPSQLIFSPSNWNVSQSVIVQPVDDVTVETTQTVHIIASTAGTGGPFSGVADEMLTVELADDDVPMILLEQTDDSTIVSELGLDDQFTLSLGTRPQSDVTLTIDGSEIPEAIFAPAEVVFTPDNWDQEQTITVSTPLDFDADKNLIGRVFVELDPTRSDSAYSGAGRRIFAVVHVDSILNDLRIREQDGRLILIDEISGQTLRSSALDDPGGAAVTMGSRSESVIVEPLPTDAAIAISTEAGDDTISLQAMAGGLIDGGEGYDTVKLLAEASLPTEPNGGVALRNIEELDLSGDGVQVVSMDASRLQAITDADNRLTVTVSPEDEFSLIGGWTIGAPALIDGVPTHTLESGTSVVQIANGAIWQNPLNALDVDKSGEVSPSDALASINRLAIQESEVLPFFPSDPDAFYFDPNGDGLSTARDALAIINALAAMSNRSPLLGESVSGLITDSGAEGESPAPEVLTDTPKLCGWESATVDQAVGELVSSDWLDTDDEEPESDAVMGPLPVGDLT